MLAVELSFPVGVLGLIVGTTYGLLAVGLVLVYRSSRVINFAHGNIGAFAAAVFGMFVIDSGTPYYVALPAVVALGAALGVVTEVAVMRRLRVAPPIVKVVATIGFASFLQAFSAVVLSGFGIGAHFPAPPGFPSFRLGPLLVGPSHSAMLLLTPVVVGGLAWLVQRSRVGVAIRGAAANADSARLSGVSASRMSAISWALAGALSAYTAVLVYPTLGLAAGTSFGPALLLRALAAAVVARMVNLPVAFMAGLGIGVIEQELLFNSPRGGAVDAALLTLILLALLFQRRRGSGREEDRGDWLVVQPWRELPPALLEVPAIRYLGWASAGLAVGVAVVLGMVVSSSSAVVLVAVLSFSVIGLGVGVISGLAGQMSLGQFALAGVGAAASFLIVRGVDNFVLSFLGAGVAGAVVSVLLGIPSVRIRGLMFAVATLAFAQAAPWVFGQDWLFGIGKDPGQPVIGSYALDTSQRYYYFTLVITIAAFLAVHNVWRGGLGRRYRAVRDNEDNARAFTISAVAVKLEAFAVAGFVTGIGGALYAHSLSAVSGGSFPIEISLTTVAIVALGGIGLMAGPILGALYLIALPRWLPLDAAGLASTQLGWLLLILWSPGGVAQAVAPLRERLVRTIARSAGRDIGGTTDGVAAEAPTLPTTQLAPEPVRAPSRSGEATPRSSPLDRPRLLATQDLMKAYGGVRAVDGITMDVLEGETLGLIGPNGAGKTTLFELIGGFAKPDAGRIVFDGIDVTALSPERRGRLGIIRSFQDAALFPTLTIPEVIALALERAMPTNVLVELAGTGIHERRKQARASEIIELMGLGEHRGKMIGELSTGTRRVAELACLLALQPKLLLLDEPTSGIAQRETEALGQLLARVKEHLGTTLVIIEHDIPLIMSISDRVVAMASGKVLITGTPAEVRTDPSVVASYLGSSTVAIERSNVNGARHGSKWSRCAATTRTGQPCSRQVVEHDLCAQHRRAATISS